MRSRLILPDALRTLMAERGVNAAELAELSGLSVGQIRYVLAGTFQFSDRSAADVAFALNTTVSKFSRAKTAAEKRAESQRRRDAAMKRTEPAA